MSIFSKKRLLLAGGAITSVGAAAALLTGATFGLFSSAGTASGSNVFTAGNVVVGLDPGGTQVTCNIGPMSPGDTQAKYVACKYVIKYTGNVNAYLAMDLKITGAPGGSIEIPYTQTTAPTAAQGLYDGSANGLQFDINDGTTSYMNGTLITPQTGAAAPLVPVLGAASVQNLLVNTTAVTTNATKTVTVNYNLPTTAGNAYNLSTSTIVLTIHAVQADNNPLPGTCAVTGKVCTTGMSWS